MKTAVLVALSLTLAACASTPKPLQGQFSTLMPDAAVQREATGELVRWGGQIVNVVPKSDRSCFEIVSTQLGSDGRPLRLNHSEGRFIACRTGFYEPEVFKSGREITITGHIDGFETRKVGEFDYRYPHVNADVVYLWPVRDDVRVIVERPYGYWGYWW